jgi:ribosome-associated toxin RatA of RatAB toxin-antitoxin module
MEVRKSLLTPYSRERMFDLIEQAENYPRFLPWCPAVTIVERNEDHVVATIHVDFKGVRFHFTTDNPKRRPEWLAFRLARGPFRHFDGEWHLAALGDAGCRIEFVLRWEFDSTMMRKLAGPIFERIADTLVDKLAAQADAFYGGATAAVAPVTAPLGPIAPGVAAAASPVPPNGSPAVPPEAPAPAAAPGAAAPPPSPVTSSPGANPDV